MPGFKKSYVKMNRRLRRALECFPHKRNQWRKNYLDEETLTPKVKYLLNERAARFRRRVEQGLPIARINMS